MFLSSSRMVEGSVNLLTDEDQTDGGADDLKSPPCTVYLYKRPVVGNEGKGAMGAKHWALYFDWGYYSCTHDANENNGLLTHFTHEGKPKSPEGKAFQVKEVRRNLRVTPHTVDEKAKQNKLNGRNYDLIQANCQTWAHELAKLLGFKLPSGQVEEYTDIALTTATAVGVVGTVLVTALKNKN